MKKNMLLLFMAVAVVFSFVESSYCNDLKSNENKLLSYFRDAIPKDRYKDIDDLYKKFQEIQSGKSDALIIDIRTEAEFNSGHILGSSNVDSGHAYGMPKKIPDSNKEIWILCRTKHRASYFVGMLYKYGYKNVYLAEGGIKGWAEKGYPLVSKYLGEIKVTKYEKSVNEDYWYRENK